MSRVPNRMAVLALGLLSSATLAATSDDAFVAQWPLALPSSDAGAYQVELDDAVYATTVSPVLRDLVVVNRDGRQVPALLQSAPAPAALPTTQALAWFPLPASAARAGSDIAAISEVDPDGRLRRIQWQSAPGDAPPAALLVDAGALEVPLQALVLDWGVADVAFERAMQVEGSEDLRAWQPLPAGGRLLDLRRGEARLVERRIVFDGPVRTRYLRLTPGAGAGTMPAIVSITGESPAFAEAPALQWRALEPSVPADAEGGFVFRLDARLPVTHVDLGLDGNATARWTLSVRETDDAPWRTVASDWLVYRVGADAASRTPPRALDTTLRARQWRLQPDAPSAGAAPVLRLGYRPERLVFVAEGAAPFSLRAGSGRAVRVDAAVAPLLADLRARNGGRWQPALATLGARTELAGAVALDDTPPRDWGTWLLWGVLLLGVVLVGGFALSLLRAPKPR
ncbi:conserved exported hypothetical protein [Luteimonas sp. 9C]|uniref:DUF3999 family protein n=1 Tax=Luteimonas sp. 9C TaxID=2653148 RepID=UPI0012F25FAC|nr:DUF3999 family protein [Luteimonas sp. 9C]VXB00832.1 conserved exported hypothetical protein [Luteimonas sp. 9C]